MASDLVERLALMPEDDPETWWEVEEGRDFARQSSIPTAKEPEMAGLDAVRERLERIKGVSTIPDNHIEIEKELTVVRVLASEALALLEGEQGEPIPLHEDPGPKGRIWRLIAEEVERASRERSYKPQRIDALVELVVDDWAGFITSEMDKRAILGTPSESGEDDG